MSIVRSNALCRTLVSVYGIEDRHSDDFQRSMSPVCSMSMQMHYVKSACCYPLQMKQAVLSWADAGSHKNKCIIQAWWKWTSDGKTQRSKYRFSCPCFFVRIRARNWLTNPPWLGVILRDKQPSGNLNHKMVLESRPEIAHWFVRYHPQIVCIRP